MPPAATWACIYSEESVVMKSISLDRSQPRADKGVVHECVDKPLRTKALVQPPAMCTLQDVLSNEFVLAKDKGAVCVQVRAQSWGSCLCMAMRALQTRPRARGQL